VLTARRYYLRAVFSTDARVAFAPETTYRALITRTTIPAWRSLSRPALVLLVLAVGVPITAVHAITLDLMLRSAAVWSVIVLVQLAIGAVVIASAPARRVSFARAIDLWFAGHLPYSLLILSLPIVTAFPIATPHELMGIAIIVPLVWTTFVVAAFCRVVLGLTPTGARWRVALHFGLVLIVGSALTVWAAGGPAAILSYALRRLSAT
jgi:hypothetical protein